MWACKRNCVTMSEPAIGIIMLVMIKAARSHFWQSECPERKLKLRAQHHLFHLAWNWRVILLHPCFYFQGSRFSFIVIIQYRIAQWNAVVAPSMLHTQKMCKQALALIVPVQNLFSRCHYAVLILHVCFWSQSSKIQPTPALAFKIRAQYELCCWVLPAGQDPQ